MNSSNGAVLDYMYLVKNKKFSNNTEISATVIAATIILFGLIVIVLIYCIKIGRTVKSDADIYLNHGKPLRLEDTGFTLALVK